MTESLLQSLIATHWRTAQEKSRPVHAIGVQSDSRWQGPDSITLDQVQIPVYQCDSVLQVRELLAEQRNGPIVLVTKLSLKELGADVEARLLRHRLLPVEPWDLLKSRFSARTLDASLNGKMALAKAAVEALGASSPDPVPAGVLTAEAAWKVVLDRRLGLLEAKPDVRAWMEWARSAENVARWKALPADLKALLEDWLKAYLGDWTVAFWGCLDAGYGQLAMAIGLVLGALRQQPDDAPARIAVAQASARLERFVNGTISPKAQQVWADAADQWAIASSTAGKFSDVAGTLAEAEDLLQRIGAQDFAYLSRWLPGGFRQRLVTLSEAVSVDLNSVEKALSSLEQHELWRWSATEKLWLERAKMAVRLARWLATPANTSTDWKAIVHNFEAHGSWVDLARQALLGGDEPEPVLKAWSILVAQVTARRERENRAFALALVDVTNRNATGDAGIPIEQVLEKVVAPWGKHGVLLLVMDGMTHAVWRELQKDIETRSWVSCSWEEGVLMPPAVAALPSVTAVSRCSLLSGRLVAGGQEAEKRGFAENPALLQVSKTGVPPLLFHKDEVGAGASHLADAVRKEIQNPNRRVVGVVVNVVDDSLSGPDQRVFRWSLDQVPLLRALLAEAEAAGRTVAITSDHGHVLDRDVQMRRQAGADRYRPADATVGEDELLVKGSRVVDPAGRYVALSTEGIRFSPVRKLGYHGGLTPQESLVPITVLAPAGRIIDGWFQAAESVPVWWYPSGVQPVTVGPKKLAKGKAKVEAPLFDGVPLLERDWVAGLASSEVLAEQLRIAGGRMELSKVKAAVRILAARNGVLLKAAFAKQMELPLFRVDGLLSNLQRVLNIDGYPVLSVDASQTVRLDIQLLKTQFGLPMGE